MKYLLLITTVMIMTGCTPKEPVKLQSNQEEVLNHNILLDQHKNIVPLDKSFIDQRYSYIIHTSKKGDMYFDNKILVKAFYLLHHANLITITGNTKIAYAYKRYLKQHGVSAPITINGISIRSPKVIIDTIHYSPIKDNKI